jgi:uncharacterized protein (DUF885 family)
MIKVSFARCFATAVAAASILAPSVAIPSPAVAGAAAAPAPHGSAFANLAARFVDESEKRDPLFADSIGVHTYDDALGDYSARGQHDRMRWLRGWRARLAAAGAAATSEDDRADARALLDSVDLELFEDQTLQPWRIDPATYTDAIGNAVYLLTGRTYAPEKERLAHVAARLALIPALAQAAEANLTRPTHTAALQAIDANDGNIRMYAALPRTPAIAARLPAALAALQKLQTFLKGPLLARADRSPRAGAAVYDRELQLAEGTDESRADLVAHAQRDVAATRARMLDLALPLDRQFFPEKTADETKPDAADVVVRRVLERLADDHPARDQVFADARADVAAADAFLTAHPVVILPKPDTLHVVPTPPFLAGFAGASFDPPGPFTPLAESFYFIDEIPAKWTDEHVNAYLRDFNTYEMRMLSMHEAVPGHYVQFRYNNATPSLVRRVFGNGSFIEGWAVYTEGMMLDAGYGGDDPKLRLFQLKWRLREQTNLLIDAGFHAGGMTKEQIEDLLVRQAYQNEAQFANKWHRLQLSHNQLSSYYVGLDTLMRAREAMRNALGDKFDLGAYNQALLAIGSVEPRFVDALVAARMTKTGEAETR